LYCGIVSWQSKGKTTVAISKTNAEYMTLSSAAQDCIGHAQNPISSQHLKNIDVRYQFLPESTLKKEFELT
jgi:hypothetical protein